MPRWAKITLGVLAGIVVLMLLNALVVSNQTKDAHVRDDGAQLVDTSGGQLQVLDEGDRQGSPIVLIHCFTCSLDWWDELAPLLTPGHRVIRLDLFGHGGSDKPGAGYSIDDEATAVTEALAKLGVSDATVVGQSLGGTVATALAERSPQLASRVVIVSQSPDDGAPNESLAIKATSWPVIGQAMARLIQVAPKSLVRDQYGRAFAPGFSIASGFPNPDQPVDDLRAMTYTAYMDTADDEERFVDEAPLDERLAAAGVPLLAIFGADDQIYDAQAAIDRYRQVPGSEVHLIPGAGHSPNVEKPEQVAPLILAFAKPTPQPKPAPAKKPPAKKNAAKKKSVATKKKSAQK
jgi:pimeloyl-ACP methyl ester carboxylesterase